MWTIHQHRQQTITKFVWSTPLIKLLKFILAVGLCLLWSSIGSAANHYVRSDGTQSFGSSTNCTAAGNALSLAILNAGTIADGDVVYFCDDGAANYTCSTVGCIDLDNSNVTYQAASGDSPIFEVTAETTIVFYDDVGYDNIVIDGLQIGTGSDTAYRGVVRISNATSTGWEIKNCTFRNAGKQGCADIVHWIDDDSDNWHIHDNNFLRGGVATVGASGNHIDIAYVTGWLIEDNVFVDPSGHTSVQLQQGCDRNVIRNNTFYTTYWNWTTDGDHTSPDHMINLIKGNTNTLIEGNIFYETGNSYNDKQTMGIQIGTAKRAIIRYNTFADVDEGVVYTYTVAGYGNIEYLKIYNNTIVNNRDTNNGNAVFSLTSGPTASYVQYCDIINNIVDGSPLWQFVRFGYGTEDVQTYNANNKVSKNIFYSGPANEIRISDLESGTTYSTVAAADASSSSPLEQMGATASSPSYDNIESDPLLRIGLGDCSAPCYSTYDFNLAPGSPAINTGMELTTVASANGTGSTFDVQTGAAFFFQSGWAGTNSDIILVGSSIDTADELTISSITDQNTIAVSASFTWVQGDKVWLKTKSDGSIVTKNSAPDIGAYEYSSTRRMMIID